MITKFLTYQILAYKSLSVTVSSLIIIFILYIVVKLILFIAKRGLKKLGKKEDFDIGRVDAIHKILSYFLWVIFCLVTLQVVGIQLTWLLASGAALMVGIGLGLQNIFNDIVSGVIILFEGSIDKGDIISIGDDMLGRVVQINIRTSHILTRKNISVIVPNHKLVDENIINWSHHKKNPRFNLKVGVAYGSPTRKVKDILLKVATNNKHIDLSPEPFVRFNNFGDSALEFELFFWSDQVLNIDDVMSEMRYCIDDEFRTEKISIPFPQRDVHIKN